MKIIKTIVIILVLFLLGLAGSWYFVTKKLATELNEKYAGKEFAIKGLDKIDYFIGLFKAN